MDMLRTDRTYANRDNAVGALYRALRKAEDVFTDMPDGYLIDHEADGIGLGFSFVVAVNADGRFAPIVIASHLRHDHLGSWLAQNGITVV